MSERLKTISGLVIACMNSMLDTSVYILEKVIQTMTQPFQMTLTVTMTPLMEAVEMETLAMILTILYAVVKISTGSFFLTAFLKVLVLLPAFVIADYFYKRFYLACQLTINMSCWF